jgi:uncharacterized protein (DUF433 family)
MSHEELHENYPTLKSEYIQAAMLYAAAKEGLYGAATERTLHC